MAERKETEQRLSDLMAPLNKSLVTRVKIRSSGHYVVVYPPQAVLECVQDLQ